MNKKYFKFDGIENGFAIFDSITNDFIRGNLVRDESEGKFKMKYQDIKLFKNIDTLASYASQNIEDFYSSGRYIVYMVISNKYISISQIQEIYSSPYEPHYEAYDPMEQCWYYGYPELKNKVIGINYFVFEDGDTNKAVDKNSTAHSYELMGYIKDAINYIIQFPNIELPLYNNGKDRRGILTVSSTNSSLKFHICLNSQLVDLNIKRKEQNTRVIPFEKSFNKFKTIFVFSTIDISDYAIKPDKVQEYKNIGLGYILNQLYTNHPELDPRLAEIEFKGTIIDDIF